MPQWLCSAAATTAAVFIPMSRCSLHPTQESLVGYSVKFRLKKPKITLLCFMWTIFTPATRSGEEMAPGWAELVVPPKH